MKKIVVLSGKGGVGKTSIAASLAVLASEDKKIIAVDCDVDAPNLSLILGLKEEDMEKEEIETSVKAEVDREKCIGCGKCERICNFSAVHLKEKKAEINKFLCEGCGACELVCPVNAITSHPVKNGWIGRGKSRYGFPVVSGHLKMGESGSGKVVEEVKKTAEINKDAELMMIDASAGIGCPVIASVKGTDYGIIVGEPTPASLSDLKKAAEVLEHFGIKYGAVINRCDINNENYEKMGAYLKEKNIEILGEIPYDKIFVDSIMKLVPPAELKKEYFSGIWKKTKSRINI
ncbi:ATP-binding protein [Candidatus Micrarchaeota archaeon]|nr:ATP-binding protein [Candidatus Micrarchaeota archaeon]